RAAVGGELGLERTKMWPEREPRTGQYIFERGAQFGRDRGVPSGDVVVGNLRVGHGELLARLAKQARMRRWENIRHYSDRIAGLDGGASYATCCRGQTATRISRPLRSRLARRPSPPVRIRFMYMGGP